MKVVLVFLFFLVQLAVVAQEKRDLLVKNYDLKMVQSALLPDHRWVEFPAYADREGWARLPLVYTQSLINQGEAALAYEWRLIPATAYLEYNRSGNRKVMEDPYKANVNTLQRLVLAELAEGKGRFLDQIINGVWALNEMTTWSLSAHLHLQKSGSGMPDLSDPVIDLTVGNTANLLAWTHYFFEKEFDKVNPLIAERIKYEINRQVLQPYYQRDDFSWMAFKNDAFVNNWNVWVNYNVLNCILLMEKDPAKRVAGVYKSMRSVDKFINYYKDDGACDEGPAYWESAGGKMYQYLQLLSKVTAGKVNIFHQEIIQNIGSYICKAYILHPYYMNFADASAKFEQEPGLIYHYGKAVKDPVMQGLGSFLSHKVGWDKKLPNGTIEAKIENMFSAGEIMDYPAREPLIADFWLAGTQVMAARDKAGSAKGFYLAAKGGHNSESHNHNDIGSSILFFNGQPILIDVGSETYTRQTFGPERYSIWTMRSTYHNLPYINSTEQKFGGTYKAKNLKYKSSPSSVKFSIDIAQAYPDSAGVREWIRGYDLRRGESFTVTDKYSLNHSKGDTYLHFMTSCEAKLTKPGTIVLSANGESVSMSYDPTVSEPVIEPIEVKDARLLQSWPKQMYRIKLKLLDKRLQGESKVTIKPLALR